MNPLTPRFRFSRVGRTKKPAEAPTPIDLEMMQRAISLARRAADHDEVPVGCVIYDTASGALITQACNQREATRDPTAHAEVIAIRDAARQLGDWRLNPLTLVVTLEPCCMCAGAIINARVGRVVFAAFDPKAGASGSLYRLLHDPRLNHRPTVIAGPASGEASDLLTNFFRNRRKG